MVKENKKGGREGMGVRGVGGGGGGGQERQGKKETPQMHDLKYESLKQTSVPTTNISTAALQGMLFEIHAHSPSQTEWFLHSADCNMGAHKGPSMVL